ncbi:hypothetical protein V6U89_29585 [Micromonospora sp. CPCC 206171]|uniref:hypothetical protein n=1 Tax=Micromonospora sp. CPCC 206171 TaxID=3122405 RepID=UPI002FF0C56F
MRRRAALVAIVLTGIAVAAPGAPAAAAPGGPAGRVCTDVRLDATLPAPPDGMITQQSITVDENCVVRADTARFLPAPSSRERNGDRRLRVWSEMYDCCGILMNALYATHGWRTADGRISQVNTGVDTDWNREPWGGGWHLAQSSQAGGCDRPCSMARLEQHAEFGYRGVFDVTGTWYRNSHDLGVTLTGDGTAACELRVTARHWFIGWTWIRGCG